MPSDRDCPSCLSKRVEYDERMGSYICEDCGMATIQDIITNEMEFVEDGSHKRAVSTFFSFPTVKERTPRLGAKKGVLAFDPNEEIYLKDEIIDRAMAIMDIIASKPGIEITDMVKPALFYYKIAYRAHLHKSRCLSHICAACLYIICRLRKTGHLLIDFAEIIQADVFLLGNIYMSILRYAQITVPLIDPALLLERYGVKSGLGPQYREICHTAARLIGRMNRDYINTGRRPNGLCGAAILVSARLHGIELSVKKMVQVVKISSAVLLKRLTDVSSTKAATLTLEDFFSEKLENMVSEDPPSYKKSRAIYKKRVALEQENKWLSPEVIEQVIKANQDIDIFRKLQETIKMGIDDFHKSNNLVCYKKKRGRPKKNENDVYTPISLNTENSEQFLYENIPIIKPLEESIKIIEGFEDDEEVKNIVLSQEEISQRAWAFDEQFENYYKVKKEKQNRKELQEALSIKRIAKGPRRRNLGLSEIAQELLLKNVRNTDTTKSRSIHEILSSVVNAGEKLETSDDFMAMCLDKKRRHTLINFAVPQHIQKLYDEKKNIASSGNKFSTETDQEVEKIVKIDIDSTSDIIDGSNDINTFIKLNIPQLDSGVVSIASSQETKTSESIKSKINQTSVKIAGSNKISRKRGRKQTKSKKIFEKPYTIKKEHILSEPDIKVTPSIEDESFDDFISYQLLHLVTEDTERIQDSPKSISLEPPLDADLTLTIEKSENSEDSENKKNAYKENGFYDDFNNYKQNDEKHDIYSNEEFCIEQDYRFNNTNLEHYLDEDSHEYY